MYSIIYDILYVGRMNAFDGDGLGWMLEAELIAQLALSSSNPNSAGKKFQIENKKF